MKWHREWFLRVPWGKLALASRGHPDGEPVLLVHGRQDSLSIFEPLIEEMSDQYYYVAIDMPGNGLSDAFPHVTNEPLPYGEPNYVVFFEKPPKPARPFINFNKFCQHLACTNKTNYGPKLMRFHFLYAMELVLTHLGWDRFIFVGHSMGCEQGLFYNVLYPGQISKMILLDAGPTLMRMQIEDNAEYQSLFYDPYYEKYKKETLGKRIRFKYTVTESMQRLRDLSRAQCNLLLSRNFHEIDWHPIQGWHPNEIRIVARKTFLVAFDDDQDTNKKLLPNGTRTMVLWNLKENDLIKLDDHVVLKQYPDEPLNIYAYGEKANLIIHLTKNAHIETITEFPFNPTNVVSQDAYEQNSDENESIDEQSLVGGDSNNNHDIPTGVPKDLWPAEQIFFLRTKAPSGKCTFEADETQSLAEGKSNEAQSDNNGILNEVQGLVEEESIEAENLVEEESNEAQSLVEEESNEAQGLVEEESNEAQGFVEEEPNEAQGLVEEKPNEAQCLVEEESNEAQCLVEKESFEAQGLFEEESNEAQGLVEEESNEAQGLVEKESNEAQSLVEEESNDAQALVEKESNEDQALLEKESNEVESSVEGRLHTQKSVEASFNDERCSSNDITNEEQGLNVGSSNGEQSSNMKRYYYCDVCIVYSRVFGNREIRQAYRLDDLERNLLKMINRRSSFPEYTVSIGCESLIPIPDDENSNEINSNRGPSLYSESTTSKDFNEQRSPSEGLRSNMPLGLDEAESSNGAQNIQEVHESEDLSLIANANYVAENPEPSNAILARSKSSNEVHGANELPNGNDSPKLPQNGNGRRDGEVPNESDGSWNPNIPQNANGRDSPESRVVGYLSWDNRLKNLAPQNYGNDYYFELFKSIPPTLLIAASDGAKNVPPIPKWRQGAKDLLDKMATLDNFHRVDVEGSHDVHYAHPERVLPFINSFLQDNRVSSKL